MNVKKIASQTFSFKEISYKVPYLVGDVAGIAKLPKFNIEDITEVAMCERIQRLEAHVAAIDQSLAECVSDVIDINYKSRNTTPVQLDGHPVRPNRGPAQQDGQL